MPGTAIVMPYRTTALRRRQKRRRNALNDWAWAGPADARQLSTLLQHRSPRSSSAPIHRRHTASHPIGTIFMKCGMLSDAAACMRKRPRTTPQAPHLSVPPHLLKCFPPYPGEPQRAAIQAATRAPGDAVSANSYSLPPAGHVPARRRVLDSCYTPSQGHAPPA